MPSRPQDESQNYKAKHGSESFLYKVREYSKKSD